MRPLMRGEGRRGPDAGKEFLERFEGDAVVAAGSFNGADAAGEDPVLERGVADAEFFGGLARGEQEWVRSWSESETPLASTLHAASETGMPIQRNWHAENSL